LFNIDGEERYPYGERNPYKRLRIGIKNAFVKIVFVLFLGKRGGKTHREPSP